MAIRIKAAQSAEEVRDVFRLRHQVYVKEEGYFQDVPGDQIIDQFDVGPTVVNLIGYDEETGSPVGVFRLNRESGFKLPSEELYDFDEYRGQVAAERQEAGLSPPKFGGAGMLAIAKPWRNRRDVFRGLLKMACAVANSWGVTHIVAAVNAKTAKIYQSLGWTFLAEKVWVPEINEHIIPVSIELDRLYQWAFGRIRQHNDLIDHFSDRFEWLLIGAQSKVFSEGEQGDEAYLIATGIVKITQRSEDEEEELRWSVLQPGEILGELSLIDDLPRSGTALAMAKTELIVLRRNYYWEKLQSDTEFLRAMLRSLSLRLREASTRAGIYAHGDLETRLGYCLDRVREDATLSKRNPDFLISKTSISELAFMANAAEDAVEGFLQEQERQQQLSISDDGLLFPNPNKP